VEILELFNDLYLTKLAYNSSASIRKLNDYARDSFAIRRVQTSKNTIIPQPFKNFLPFNFRALIPVV
jgi:hypothetical protein